MFRLFFLAILLTSTQLFACSLCAMYTPTAEVTVEFKTEKEKLLSVRIAWEFSEKFTEEILKTHDRNRNGTLEDSEMETVRKAMYDYLKNADFLTTLSLAQAQEEPRTLPNRVTGWEFRLVDGKPRFDYTLQLDATLDHESALSLSFWDEGNYFAFHIKKTGLKLPPAWHIEQQVDGNTVDYYIYDRNRFISDSINPDEEKIILPDEMSPPALPEKNPLVALLENALKKLSEAINGYVTAINKEGSLLSYLWLLLFSFLYGVIHAAGPGHGKSLVASYFLASDHSYAKAFSVASLIAVVHTFSAFVSTLIIYFVLTMFFAQFFEDLTFFTTKISALLIVAIALYLLYKKIPKKRGLKWHTHPVSCSCNACTTDAGTTELGIIVSAGIIPCPGTVTIFMLTLSLGEYFVGFLSALFMSIGMSLIILFASVLSIGVRKKATERFRFLRTLLDYGSLVFIMLLGITLFFVEI